MAFYKGKKHILEVHGSEPRIDVRKNLYAGEGKRIDIPSSIKTGQQYLDWAKRNDIIVSGIDQDRFQMGFPVIETDVDKTKFLKYLKKMDIRGDADSSEPFSYNSIIDFDRNIFYSMKNNWYDDYSKYLPPNWTYKEYAKPEEETEIVLDLIGRQKSPRGVDYVAGKKGWKFESARHGLAAKGIKTGRKTKQIYGEYKGFPAHVYTKGKKIKTVKYLTPTKAEMKEIRER